MKDGVLDKGKRGTVNWTIGRLLNIILLVLVLVLVIYGVTTKGLNPLIKNLGEKFDEVKFMFGFGDSSSGCYTVNIADVGGGLEFMKELGIDSGADLVLNYGCENICNISGAGLGNYRVKDGMFEGLHGKDWVKEDLLFGYNVVPIKFQKDLYDTGVEILKKDSVQDIYEKGITKQFILYGDGAGKFDSPTEAIWQNGIWSVSVDGGKFKTIKDDNEALDKFVGGVWDHWDDKVYWKEILLKPGELSYIGNDHGRPIDDFISVTVDYNSGDTGDVESNIVKPNDANEIDSEEDVAKLKNEFFIAKERLLNEARVSKEDVEKIRKAVEGKTKIDDKIFIVGVEENKYFPIITFSLGDSKYGLKHSVSMRSLSYLKFYNNGGMSRVKLKSYPISLVSWNRDKLKWEEMGKEDYYRLPDNYFLEMYKVTIVRNFLVPKCLT